MLGQVEEAVATVRRIDPGNSAVAQAVLLGAAIGQRLPTIGTLGPANLLLPSVHCPSPLSRWNPAGEQFLLSFSHAAAGRPATVVVPAKM
jgi:hypothetical protein